VTDAEFLVFLYELEACGLGTLDRAIGLAGDGPSKWCRTTTTEKWYEIYPYLEDFKKKVNSGLLAIAEEILP